MACLPQGLSEHISPDGQVPTLVPKSQCEDLRGQFQMLGAAVTALAVLMAAWDSDELETPPTLHPSPLPEPGQAPVLSHLPPALP